MLIEVGSSDPLRGIRGKLKKLSTWVSCAGCFGVAAMGRIPAGFRVLRGEPERYELPHRFKVEPHLAGFGLCLAGNLYDGRIARLIDEEKLLTGETV